MTPTLEDTSRKLTLQMQEWHPTSTHASCKRKAEKEREIRHLRAFD